MMDFVLYVFHEGQINAPHSNEGQIYTSSARPEKRAKTSMTLQICYNYAILFITSASGSLFTSVSGSLFNSISGVSIATSVFFSSCFLTRVKKLFNSVFSLAGRSVSYNSSSIGKE